MYACLTVLAGDRQLHSASFFSGFKILSAWDLLIILRLCNTADGNKVFNFHYKNDGWIKLNHIFRLTNYY